VNKKEIVSTLVSCAVTTALLVVFESAFPDRPLGCSDGWDSSSIGLQGACSHHGGVTGGGDATPGYLIFLSFAAGFGTLLGLAKTFKLFQAPAEKSFSDRDTLLILDAIQNHATIEFQYLKRHSPVAETRRMMPTEIKFLAPGRRRSRCVVGYCSNARDTRTFTLSRMSHIRVVEA
jgi:hypothetical protein